MTKKVLPMKKIMFNDKYRLTQAVLNGRKTQTRRVVVNGKRSDIRDAAYRIGEEVAVAQSYHDAKKEVGGLKGLLEGHPLPSAKGINNKMFVKADLMPHRIKITNVRVERLQDISEQDCLKEGFEKINVNDGVGNMLSHLEFLLTYEDKLGRSLQLGSRDYKEAFGILIDNTCGNGTWDSNPLVFVYDFEIIH